MLTIFSDSQKFNSIPLLGGGWLTGSNTSITVINNVEVPQGSVATTTETPTTKSPSSPAPTLQPTRPPEATTEAIENEFKEVIKTHDGAPLPHLNDAPIWPLVRGVVLGKEQINVSPQLKWAILSSDDKVHRALEESIDFVKGEIIQKRLGANTGCKAPSTEVTRIVVTLDEEYEVNPPIPNIVNEKYVMYVGTNGVGIVRIKSRFGLLRALSTFAQLIQPRADCSASLALKAPFLIVDQPAYPHRGLLLDTARNFYSLDSILRIVRALGMAKMNVLHWHFVDDQSFGIRFESVPELAESAHPEDTSNTKVYSVADVKKVIELGRQWGVRIIPELDLPGHTGGWNRVKGMLPNCPTFSCGSAYGLTLHPYSNTTWTVLDKIIREVAELFPDPAMHLGGDEVQKGCWMEDQSIASIASGTKKHWTYFENRFNSEIVGPTKKDVIKWEDCHHLYEQTGPDAIAYPKGKLTFHIWMWWGQDWTWTKRQLDKGHSLISSMGLYMDKDCLTWGDCYAKHAHFYADRLHLPQAVLDDPNGILGAEGCPWEMTEGNLESENLWLRFIAIAEPMWSSSAYNITSKYPWGRGRNVGMNGATEGRIMALCRLLSSEMKLFSGDMCRSWGNRGQITQHPAFKRRVVERETMICNRIVKDPPAPCMTAYCVSARAGQLF